MNKITVKPATIAMEYQGDLRVTSEHLRSGSNLLTDAPVDNKGKGEAFSPTDLVATALGTCLLTVMGIEANKLNINMKGVKADVLKIMASKPRRIAKLQVTVDWNFASITDSDKKALKEAIKICPVCNSLNTALEININYIN